jgi:glycosyltransferase involved in cell wall biosynthesis
MLSMSEHEGFSVPLLEAFHFGVPVVARPAGAMPEVGGDAVLWDTRDDLAVTAELLELAVRDGELRSELERRGREQLERFSYERTAAEIVDAVEEALA